jgi:hypothetical protein
LAQGLVQYKLGQGLHVYWVQDEQHAEVALQYLQRSMQVLCTLFSAGIMLQQAQQMVR